MNKFIFLTVMILIFSCKESTNSRNKVLDDRMKDGVSKVDYHKIMDVVLDTFKIQHDKIIYIEYKPSKKAIDTSRRNFILNNSNLSKDEKKIAIQLLETEKDSFNFNKAKLNQNSLEILKNTGKTTDRNLTYYFGSFLSNKENDLVVSTVGAIMNNESHTTGNSGAELIMFFRKGRDDHWKLSNFISTVEY